MILTTTQRKLVEDNQGLAYAIAKHFGEDAIQDALMGLCRAASDYSGEVGKFSTYATYWIRSYVNRQYGKSKSVPDYIRGAVKQHNALRQSGMTDCEIRVAMSDDTGRVYIDDNHAPKFEVVSQYANLAIGTINVSNDDDQGDDLDVECRDSTIDIPVSESVGADVESFLSVLDARSRQVMELRYGIRDGQPMTLDAIGATLGVSKERVRQLEAKALKSMQRIA